MDKNRNLEPKLNQLLNMFPVVALIGARQSGKSTLVKKLRPDWQYYDLESPDDYQLISNDPVAFFELNQQRIIIDEAQQYPGIFNVLRGVIDADRNTKGRFILTGSSSPEISKGITETLAGRIAMVEMWPFKANEFADNEASGIFELIGHGIKDPKEFKQLQPTSCIQQVMDIWYQGGFPEPLLASRTNKEFARQWMENYIVNYIGRDIRSLFPKLNIHNFRRFLTLLAQFSGHQLNMSNIARSLEVSVSTIRDYLDIIHQTFIWRNLESYGKNRLKKVQKARKGFFRDQGLLHYFLKIMSVNDLLIHPVAGFSFESYVIEEFIRGFQATLETQLEFNYYRSIDKSEVDLIVDGAFGVVPVEVKLASSVPKLSLRGLEIFIADMNLDYGIVINRAKRIELLTDKIVQIPVNYI